MTRRASGTAGPTLIGAGETSAAVDANVSPSPPLVRFFSDRSNLLRHDGCRPAPYAQSECAPISVHINSAEEGRQHGTQQEEGMARSLLNTRRSWPALHHDGSETTVPAPCVRPLSAQPLSPRSARLQETSTPHPRVPQMHGGELKEEGGPSTAYCNSLGASPRRCSNNGDASTANSACHHRDSSATSSTSPASRASATTRHHRVPIAQSALLAPPESNSAAPAATAVSRLLSLHEGDEASTREVQSCQQRCSCDSREGSASSRSPSGSSCGTAAPEFVRESYLLELLTRASSAEFVGALTDLDDAQESRGVAVAGQAETWRRASSTARRESSGQRRHSSPLFTGAGIASTAGLSLHGGEWGVGASKRGASRRESRTPSPNRRAARSEIAPQCGRGICDAPSVFSRAEDPVQDAQQCDNNVSSPIDVLRLSFPTTMAALRLSAEDMGVGHFKLRTTSRGPSPSLARDLFGDARVCAAELPEPELLNFVTAATPDPDGRGADRDSAEDGLDLSSFRTPLSPCPSSVAPPFSVFPCAATSRVTSPVSIPAKMMKQRQREHARVRRGSTSPASVPAFCAGVGGAGGAQSQTLRESFGSFAMASLTTASLPSTSASVKDFNLRDVSDGAALQEQEASSLLIGQSGACASTRAAAPSSATRPSTATTLRIRLPAPEMSTPPLLSPRPLRCPTSVASSVGSPHTALLPAHTSASPSLQRCASPWSPHPTRSPSSPYGGDHTPTPLRVGSAGSAVESAGRAGTWGSRVSAPTLAATATAAAAAGGPRSCSPPPPATSACASASNPSLSPHVSDQGSGTPLYDPRRELYLRRPRSSSGSGTAFTPHPSGGNGSGLASSARTTREDNADSGHVYFNARSSTFSVVAREAETAVAAAASQGWSASQQTQPCLRLYPSAEFAPLMFGGPCEEPSGPSLQQDRMSACSTPPPSQSLLPRPSQGSSPWGSPEHLHVSFSTASSGASVLPSFRSTVTTTADGLHGTAAAKDPATQRRRGGATSVSVTTAAASLTSRMSRSSLPLRRSVRPPTSQVTPPRCEVSKAADAPAASSSLLCMSATRWPAGATAVAKESEHVCRDALVSMDSCSVGGGGKFFAEDGHHAPLPSQTSGGDSRLSTDGVTDAKAQDSTGDVAVQGKSAWPTSCGDAPHDEWSGGVAGWPDGGEGVETRSFSTHFASSVQLAPPPPLMKLPHSSPVAASPSSTSSSFFPPSSVPHSTASHVAAQSSAFSFHDPVVAGLKPQHREKEDENGKVSLRDATETFTPVPCDRDAETEGGLRAPATSFLYAFSSLRGPRSRQEDGVSLTPELLIRALAGTAEPCPAEAGVLLPTPPKTDGGSAERSLTSAASALPFTCFGVFDGHCGDTVSSLASQYFPEHFEHAVQVYWSQWAHDKDRGAQDPCVPTKSPLAWLRSAAVPAEFQRVVSAALVQSLVHLDLTLYDALHQKTRGRSSSTQRRDAGSTASVVAFFKLPPQRTQCGSAGDTAPSKAAEDTEMNVVQARQSGSDKQNQLASTASSITFSSSSSSRDREHSQELSGATATDANAASTGDIYRLCIANLGDSRAIIGNRRTGQLLLATTDHRISACPAEAARIAAAGGVVELGRVDGSLDVTRGLGDYRYKVDPAQWWAAVPSSTTTQSAVPSSAHACAAPLMTGALSAALLPSPSQSRLDSSTDGDGSRRSGTALSLETQLPEGGTETTTNGVFSPVRALRWPSSSSSPVRDATNTAPSQQLQGEKHGRTSEEAGENEGFGNGVDAEQSAATTSVSTRGASAASGKKGDLSTAVEHASLLPTSPGQWRRSLGNLSSPPARAPQAETAAAAAAAHTVGGRVLFADDESCESIDDRAEAQRCGDEFPTSPPSTAASSCPLPRSGAHATRSPLSTSSPASPLNATAALTGNAVSNIADVYEWEVHQEDVLIIASDGVWDSMTSEEVLMFVCRELMDLGAEREDGGGDDGGTRCNTQRELSAQRATAFMHGGGLVGEPAETALTDKFSPPTASQCPGTPVQHPEKNALFSTPLRQPSALPLSQALCTPCGDDNMGFGTPSAAPDSASRSSLVQTAARHLTEHVVNTLSGSDNTTAIVVVFQ